MTLTLGHTPVELLLGRAAFLPNSATLVIADLHLGKSATFRARGLPVPEGDTHDDLARLSHLIQKTSARALVIAGDLFHSSDGLSAEILTQFRTWLETHPIPVTLTQGNHDRRALFTSPKLLITPSLVLDGLLITHDPADLTASGIAGHLHPGARIADRSRHALRLPGFLLKNQTHLILPAFSHFTGIAPITPNPDHRFFAETSTQIVEIPTNLIRP